MAKNDPRRVDTAILARAAHLVGQALDEEVAAHDEPLDGGHSVLDDLVDAAIASLTDVEVLEIKSRVRNAFMARIRHHTFVDTCERAIDAQIKAIATVELKALTHLDSAVRDIVKEHLPRSIDRAVREVIDAGVDEAKQLLISKLEAR